MQYPSTWGTASLSRRIYFFTWFQTLSVMPKTSCPNAIPNYGIIEWEVFIITFIWFTIATLSIYSVHSANSTKGLSVLIGELLREILKEILSKVLTTILLPYTLCAGRLYYTIYRVFCQLALCCLVC